MIESCKHSQQASFGVSPFPLGVQMGHEVHNLGNTPLHCAAKQGHLEVSKILLENHFHGRHTRNARNHNGWTPLHSAAQVGNSEVCKILLEHNRVDKNPTNKTGKLKFSSMFQD